MFNIIRLKAIAKIDLTYNGELVLSKGEKCTIVELKSMLSGDFIVRIKFKRFGKTQYYGMTDLNNFIIE